MKLYFENLITILIPALPNIVYLFLPPKEIPEERSGKDISYKVLVVTERVGQVGVFTLPLFWKATISDGLPEFSLAAIVLFAVLYYAGWIRYFVKGRHYRLLFSPLLKIPIPLAVSPILYFFALSLLLQSIILLIAATLLSIGHLSVSWREWEWVLASEKSARKVI